MEVTGIRSFNPEKAQAIKFSSPVTLIVGQNGSGKTVSCNESQVLEVFSQFFGRFRR